MAEPYAESPLAAYTDVLARSSTPGQVHITEMPFTTQVDLRVDPKSPAAERIGTALGAMLPNQPGEVAVAGELSVLWLGPDEWLLLGPEGSQEAIRNTVSTALDGDHAAVVDVSANRTILSVAGPKARELLNKGCALDLHPRSFTVDRCAQTLLARAGVTLVCRDTQLPSFWVIVRSSFARYLADWLVDAAAEYGESGGEP
ncbi:sarcosine oxidase subunit gamma [Haloactinomyces albus]|uniref:Sarcosine oxidase subunit gamma n=1 Tax=Haloactinomyces albus TaxID=1352928 RepID=A0AAE4CNF5_9ACTN|nr:sarcosine oxidase subunit gamma family protein [Haloactinomyces albus]MDR7303849.1 sarcosine oxidase subunit gamma [Haloactinomyces albus]